MVSKEGCLHGSIPAVRGALLFLRGTIYPAPLPSLLIDHCWEICWNKGVMA